MTRSPPTDHATRSRHPPRPLRRHLSARRRRDGQVWQATDTQLNRQVALKILPDAFAADPDRLARFTREAQILASLNHPNIAAIYGIEEADGTRALVLELVEGPTLADRIAKGPIPVDEALPIAKQIAEALEAAHEAGVIHRDLKPANIKVREDGTVKVLDFGLAKALDPNPEGDPSQSPTLTAAATQMGVIMGTAAYMSPEQARGKPVDKRADIWAFGCVLYEILTGRRAFRGETSVDILADVIGRDPDHNLLPANLPSSVHRIIRRCLVKDRKGRLRDIGDAGLDISELLAAPVSKRGEQEALRREVAVRQYAGEKSGDADASGSRANADRRSRRRKWTLSLSTPRGRTWKLSFAISMIFLFFLFVLPIWQFVVSSIPASVGVVGGALAFGLVLGWRYRKRQRPRPM